MTPSPARFDALAERTCRAVGSAGALILGAIVVGAWVLIGAAMGLPGWEPRLNTTLAVATTLLVVLLQAGQNRATKAIELKLDAVLRSVGAGDDPAVAAEDLPSGALDEGLARAKAKAGIGRMGAVK